MQIPDITLRSPRFDECKIVLSSEIAQLHHPYNGTIGSSCGDEYTVNRNIVELLGDDTPETSLAQSTNFLSLTADAYEDYWRNHSIKMISGQEYSIDDEKKRLLDWLQPGDGKKYIDIGCSTALYARTIAANAAGAGVVALDFSRVMLKKARDKATAENVQLYLVQADAENLPFFASGFDGAVIGGSLNEFRDPVRALYEARRVLRKDGLLFIMYLLKADSIIGSALQKLTGIGGISFWSEQESSQLFERTGFRVMRSERVGIVHFCLLSPQ